MSEAIRKTIICRCRDRHGEITISDNDGIRSLYFGSVLQSSLRIDRPAFLTEDYNEAMMSALIFRNSPRSILLIGLGGCSLVHFLLRSFPGCEIDVIEIRQHVIDMASEYFLLPRSEPGLKIFHAAGQDFIRKQDTAFRNYDLIVVDAFDESGPAGSLLEREFLITCRKRLQNRGVFVINLWNRPEDNFPALYATLREAFGNNTLKLLLAETYRNAIVFGCNDLDLFRDLPAYRPAARTLQKEYNINFPKYLRSLYWQNFL